MTKPKTQTHADSWPAYTKVATKRVLNIVKAFSLKDAREYEAHEAAVAKRLKDELAATGTARLKGIGTLTIVPVAARLERDPITGRKVKMIARMHLKFTAAKTLFGSI